MIQFSIIYFLVLNMDFSEQIENLSEKIIKIKETMALETEEATKNAFIMPMLQILGYDVFNPLEVVPEFTADIGTKKGEKVDYAILQEGKPIIIIECKHHSETLNAHNSQLARYFHTVHARFAIITNGINYQFYSDLEENNKMDNKPFLEFDLQDYQVNIVNELKKFHRNNFDIDKILSTASNLKYCNAIKTVVNQELSSPSDEFVRFFGKIVHNGVLTSRIIDELRPLVSKAFSEHISEKTSEIFKKASADITHETTTEENSEEEITKERKIETTQDELEGYHIVRAIARQEADVSRIIDKDTLSYFAVLLDGNTRKPLCRLYLNTRNWYIGLFHNGSKNEIKEKLECLDDIYKYAEQIIQSVKNYENANQAQKIEKETLTV